jgi:MFS family permease
MLTRFSILIWCATGLLQYTPTLFFKSKRNINSWNNVLSEYHITTFFYLRSNNVQGIMYCAAPLLFASYSQYPHFCQQSTFIGLPIVALAILLSSFATSVWHLTLTQGVLYAIGGGLLYYPVFIFIDEWFVRRKGFAYGVMWAGSGSGGLIGPLVLDWGLHRYGPRVFLRGWAVALVCRRCPVLFSSALTCDAACTCRSTFILCATKSATVAH